MKLTNFNVATHFSIVWGVTLAVISLLEWNTLDRDPVRQEILSPFIERTIAVTVEVTVIETPYAIENGAAPTDVISSLTEREESPDAVLRYDVEFHFNGPLFLACFFGPILVFHGVRLLWERMRGG